jgi:undecaprenyl-diphosphatase
MLERTLSKDEKGGTVTPIGLAQSIVEFDRGFMLALNTLVGRAPALDHLASLITTLPLLKSVPIIALCYWLWIGGDDQLRSRLLATIASAFASFGLARLLAHVMPFRLRPLHDAAMALKLPIGMDAHQAQFWSSFPSDHAAMLGALAAGLWLIRPVCGWISVAWGVVMVLLPRVYVGMHYPIDCIGGLIVGIAGALILNHARLRQPLWRAGKYWSQTHARSFAAAAFLSTYLLATNGDDVRTLLGYFKKFL